MTRLTRRRFLGASAAAAAALAAAACGDGKRRTRQTPAAPSATPPAVVTSRGGTLRVYNYDAMIPDTLDPHLTSGGPIANVHSAIFSRLLRYRDEVAGDIAPDLAATLPEQPDEQTYVFRLREGVTFHDTPRIRERHPGVAGRTLEAAEVQYSIERQLNRNSPQANRYERAGQLAMIDRVEARDATTLVIRTKEPMASLAGVLAGRHAFVIPREIVDPVADEVSGDGGLPGTGPFVLDSFQPGTVVKLRRNETWFARDDDGSAGMGRPYIDGYEAYFSPQEDAFQAAAFGRRLVDATEFLDTESLGHERTTNLGDIAIHEQVAGGVLASRLLLDRAPFRDDRVRRALHLAIDRRGIADLLYPALAGEPSSRLAGPVGPAFTRWALTGDDLARRPGYRSEHAADVAEAKQLWAAALGDAPVADIVLFFAGIPRTLPEIAAAAIERQVRDALGVNVVLHTDRSGDAVVRAALRRNIESATEGVAACTFMFEDGGPDLDDWLASFRSGHAGNTYRLQDATLDAQIDRQRREFDAEERSRIGREIQEYLLGKVNARLEYCAPVTRRLTWGYVRNAPGNPWYGGDGALADTWLDAAHPAWRVRPAALG